MSDDPLHDWQEWGIGLKQRPRLVVKLNSGRINRHYLLEADDQRLVLRRNNPNTDALGINRAHEALILDRVSQAGLFPTIILSSIEKGLLITEFVEGRFWKKSSLVHREKLVRLVDRLKEIHDIQLELPAFDYLAHCENYWNTLLELDFSPTLALKQRHLLYLDMVKNIASSGELCHHDPIRSNIVESSGRLYFLDWEYAGCGWPSFDFAALSHDWSIDPGMLCKLADCDNATFSDAQFMYSHLCELWELINKLQGS